MLSRCETWDVIPKIKTPVGAFFVIVKSSQRFVVTLETALIVPPLMWFKIVLACSHRAQQFCLIAAI